MKLSNPITLYCRAGAIRYLRGDCRAALSRAGSTTDSKEEHEVFPLAEQRKYKPGAMGTGAYPALGAEPRSIAFDMTNTELLRKRLLAAVIDTTVGDKREPKESLRRSEWSPTFERLMRNRLLVGRYRYGRMDRDQDTDYDRVASILHRLEDYQKHGNMEHLVDIANLCLIEFEHAAHDKAHFDASDDADHVRKRTQYEGE